MRFRVTYYLLLLLVTGMASCTVKSNDEKINEWFTDTKEEILDQADVEPDSMFENINLNTGQYERWHYYENRKVKYEVTNEQKTPSYTVLYAEDTNFALVREYCMHGNLSYEGISYKNKPYGTATWYDCETGNVMEQGNRFKFKKSGSWKKFHQNGELKSEHIYKGKIKLKSLPELD